MGYENPLSEIIMDNNVVAASGRKWESIIDPDD